MDESLDVSLKGCKFIFEIEVVCLLAFFVCVYLLSCLYLPNSYDVCNRGAKLVMVMGIVQMLRDQWGQCSALSFMKRNVAVTRKICETLKSKLYEFSIYV